MSECGFVYIGYLVCVIFGFGMILNFVDEIVWFGVFCVLILLMLLQEVQVFQMVEFLGNKVVGVFVGVVMYMLVEVSE